MVRETTFTAARGNLAALMGLVYRCYLRRDRGGQAQRLRVA